MTTQKLFKRRVRERLAKTGESSAADRRHVATDGERLEESRTRLASAKELASDDKLVEATGRDWEAWLTILDRWGARRHDHRAIVKFLTTEHGVPSWWTQTITNGYERASGARAKHQQANGFTIYASRTVAVPLSVLFEAFVDEGMRTRWLTDGSMSLRTSQPDRTARFDWGDGTTRVLVTFEAKGPSKASAHVSHERLPDADVAEIAKSLWKKRVTALKTFLESTDV